MFKNLEELNKAYGIDNIKKRNRSNFSEKEERDYINDLFDLYETIGFFKTIGNSLDSETSDSFTVIGRVKELKEDVDNGADIELLPMWHIQIPTGDTLMAYPNDICIAPKMKGDKLKATNIIIGNEMKSLEIDIRKLNEYLKRSYILEFATDEACMNFFNIDGNQAFGCISEMKKYQGINGFNIGNRRFHISCLDALDVFCDIPENSEIFENDDSSTAINFTNEEICILSDALLLLIQNTNKALILVHGSECINALTNTLEKYQKLNQKICKWLN